MQTLDETDPQVTIEQILHRIETGETTVNDALELRRQFQILEEQVKVKQERIDIVESLYRVNSFSVEHTVTGTEAVLFAANEYLKSLPDDDTRLYFINGLEVCLHCGALERPCYCMADD